MAEPGFELRAVRRSRGGTELLHGVDLDLPARGVTALLGPSGAGKTTLLRLLNRLDAPDRGTVRWRGRDLAEVDPCALRREVGFLAQRPVTFEGTVADNLRVADPSLDDTGVAELLGPVGLEGKGGRDARSLSGGEAQRLCLARSLATGPAVMLADEPTASLDAEARDRVETIVRDLVAARGTGWVMVTHDPGQARRLADTGVVLVAGNVVATGPLEELADHDDPTVRRSVGGVA